MKCARTALIIGAGGQDGRLLLKHLESRGVRCIATVTSTQAQRELERDAPDRLVVQLDIRDIPALQRCIAELDFDWIFNLAARSSVAESWEDPLATFSVNAAGAVSVMELAHRKILEGGRSIRLYQASSSEMFGASRLTAGKMSEDAPLVPLSPYAVAKTAAHNAIRMYREAYGHFFVSGILFNHESIYRPESYVSRRISRGVAAIKLGLADTLSLQNTAVVRDWGDARDYVRAMYQMVDADEPRDYVVSTGVGRTVLEFAETAFELAGLEDVGARLHATELSRPIDTPVSLGDSTRIRSELGWCPQITFREMVRSLVEHDLESLSRGPLSSIDLSR